MTVGKLISLLKKMPQKVQVGVAAHDNSEHEVAGWPSSVILLDKSEITCPDYADVLDRDRYNSLPQKTVIIRC
jgi:hypothetical protein